MKSNALEICFLIADGISSALHQCLSIFTFLIFYMFYIELRCFSSFFSFENMFVLCVYRLPIKTETYFLLFLYVYIYVLFWLRFTRISINISIIEIIAPAKKLYKNKLLGRFWKFQWKTFPVLPLFRQIQIVIKMCKIIFTFISFFFLF